MFLDNPLARRLNAAHLTGAVAQMGERCNRTAEVRGSIPLGSTNHNALIFISILAGRIDPH